MIEDDMGSLGMEEVVSVDHQASGYQEECGILALPDLSGMGSVLVLSEVIPSWLLLVDSWGCQKVTLWVKDELLAFRRNLNLGMKVLTHLTLDRAFGNFRARDLSVPSLILVQGSTNFVSDVGSRVCAELKLNHRTQVIAVAPRQARAQWPTDFRLRRVRHKTCGGISKSSFVVATRGGSNKIENPKAEGVTRSLTGIIKSSLGGSPAPSPASTLGNIKKVWNKEIEDSVRLWELVDTFRLPSVFSKSGWASRRLSGGELCAAIDLPPCVSAEVGSALEEDEEMKLRILGLPPVKVLQAVNCGLTDEGGNGSLPSIFRDPRQAPSLEKISLSTFNPKVELEAVKSEHSKAVKSDDAATETKLWEDRVLTTPSADTNWTLPGGGPVEMNAGSLKLIGKQYDVNSHGKIFKFLRNSMVLRFGKSVCSSFRRYLISEYSTDELARAKSNPTSVSQELQRDLKSGRDAIARARGSSFWDWDAGSFPFFWRWQPEVKRDMRDGTPLFVNKDKLPKFMRKQKISGDQNIKDRVKLKLSKVILRGYLALGAVLSLTSYFHVPKGEDDIRMVYDATACGLNDALWAPTFWMPTILNVLDAATETSWFGDVDAGEMFLNYPLDIAMRAFAGVDVSWMYPDNPGCTWYRWTRMAMGLRSSPWVTTRLFAWAMEIIKGDRRDPLNPFHWTEVRLNLPGSSEYDPSSPRVYRWNPIALAIACECVTFVDDLRSIGPTVELIYRATHQVETRMGYLGLQDATRKRRPNTQRPGEWTGSMTLALPGVGLFATVAQKKWDKAKTQLSTLLSNFDSPSHLPMFDLKDLERKVGFLVHLGMTYPLMRPFLRSFYLTMNSWRPGRDSNGWKLSPRAYQEFLGHQRGILGQENGAAMEDADGEAPSEVKATSSLYTHLRCLNDLFGSDVPTLRLIRGSEVLEVCYMFGDASGEGFGASWESSQGVISYRFGVWGHEGTDTSSNYRELRNLVDTLEVMGEKGELNGKELFVFTDNLVAESVVAKGSSSSELLFELVVRIYKLEMNCRCNIRFVHVAGTRMIRQGTDGLSRGDMYEGIMRGDSMLSHIPLHLSALERSPRLLTWVQSWCCQFSKNKLEVLTPTDWFERGHDILGSRTNVDGMWMPRYKPGTMLWVPPPAAGRFVMSEIRQARQKRQDSFHIVIIPRLMTPEWKKHMWKSADVLFDIPAGVSFWKKEMHEPLTLALYFPYLHRSPWELKGSKLMVDMGRKLHGLFKTDESLGFDLLSELCIQARGLDSLPFHLLRKVLSGRRNDKVPEKSRVWR